MYDRQQQAIVLAGVAAAAGYALRLLIEKRSAARKSSHTKPTVSAGAVFKGKIKEFRHGANVLHLLFIGERLGLIEALIEAGPMSSEQLASTAGIHVRYAKEWTLCMAANEVLDYDTDAGTFAVKAELRGVLRDESTLGLAPGAVAFYQAHERILEAYKTGTGIGWGEFSPLLAQGARRFFQPLYENHLISNLPLDAATKMKTPGAAVADIGCGEGISTAVLAREFPQCTFVGYDSHELSIREAREAARRKDLTNVTFECTSAEVSGSPASFDVVLFFDCFHDMPVASAAAKNAFNILRPGGLVLLIELNSSEEDTVEAKLALKTTSFLSTLSCHCCLCVGMCDGGDGLGTLVPTCRVRTIFVDQAGFTSLERVHNDKFDSLGFRIMLARK